MTHEQFIYWLTGFIEANLGKPITDEQWKTITDQLKTVTKAKPEPDLNRFFADGGLGSITTVPCKIPGGGGGNMIPMDPFVPPINPSLNNER